MNQELILPKWESRRFKVFKFCRICGDRFKPHGKYAKICDPCLDESKKGNKKK